VQILSETLLILRRTERRNIINKICLLVKYSLFLSDFKELRSFRNIYEKCSYIKLHENLSNGRRVVPCGQTEGQTGMMKLIFPFRSFANAPKKNIVLMYHKHSLQMSAQK
jgi:hypothetical protein